VTAFCGGMAWGRRFGWLLGTEVHFSVCENDGRNVGGAGGIVALYPVFPGSRVDGVVSWLSIWILKRLFLGLVSPQVVDGTWG